MRWMVSNLILVVFILPKSLYGQQKVENPTLFGIRSHNGFIIAHSSELEEISQSNPWGFQVEWSKLMIKDKSWNNCNCYAQSGVSFTYFNYNNPDQLGNSYNLIYFAEPYLSYTKKLFYSFRAGAGLSFLDTVYDEEQNPENTFYSTHLSFILLLNFNVNYRISPYYTLSATANYNHISNGGMQEPNKGMNFPTFGIGLSYSPKTFKLERKPKANNDKGKITGYARLFSTLPSVDATDELPEERRLLIGISSGVLWHVTNFNAINLGAEFIRDGARREKAERTDEDFDHHIIGLTLGHNFIFGKFTFNQQLGVYLHNPDPDANDDFFQRYELLYLLGKRYQIGTSLKAHGHVAENLDLRFGILF